MDSKVIKKTQETLGKVIKKPPLTEKLLNKPPFRFLHDVITEIIKHTGLLRGLYTEKELSSSNVTEKDAKMLFLQKSIDCVGFITGDPLSIRPSKIVAGHEPEKTNEFLQALGKVSSKKIDTTEIVKKVLSGEKPVKKSSSKSLVKEKESKERPKETEKKSERSREKDSSKEKEKESSKDREKEKSKDKERSRDKTEHAKDKEQHDEKRNSKSRDDKHKTDEKGKERSSRRHREQEGDNPEGSKHREKKHRDGSGSSRNKEEKKEERKDKERRRDSSKETENKSKDRHGSSKEHRSSSKERQGSSKERQSSSKERLKEKSKDTKSSEDKENEENKEKENRSSEKHKEEREKTKREKSGKLKEKESSENNSKQLVSEFDFENEDKKDENKDQINNENHDGEEGQGSSRNIQRPASAKGQRRRPSNLDSDDDLEQDKENEPPAANEDNETIESHGTDDLRKQSGVRRQARPSSARPAPPRLKKVEVVEEPAARVNSGKPIAPVIMDKKKEEEEDEDDTFVVEEDPSLQNFLEVKPSGSNENFISTEEHGSLVRKMLESKKEADSHTNPATTNNKEKEQPVLYDAARRKEKEMAEKEIEKLRGSIQNLVRSAHPLGKIMDYIQEDIDSMKKELQVWSEENTQHEKELKSEESITENEVEPLQAHLNDLELEIGEMMDNISNVKSNILRNEEQIDDLLSGVVR